MRVRVTSVAKCRALQAQNAIVFMSKPLEGLEFASFGKVWNRGIHIWKNIIGRIKSGTLEVK